MNAMKRMAAGLLTTGFLVPVLGGCTASTTPEAAQASAASAALNGQFTELMPRLVDPASDAADMKYRRVREDSCLRPEVDDPQTNTAWIGSAVGTVTNESAAEKALDAIDTQLADDGWEKKSEVTPADNHPSSIRTLFYRKGDVGVTAELRRSVDRPTMAITATSGCADQPTSHRMQRSELDPDYGKNSQYYDDAK